MTQFKILCLVLTFLSNYIFASLGKTTPQEANAAPIQMFRVETQDSSSQKEAAALLKQIVQKIQDLKETTPEGSVSVVLLDQNFSPLLYGSNIARTVGKSKKLKLVSFSSGDINKKLRGFFDAHILKDQKRAQSIENYLEGLENQNFVIHKTIFYDDAQNEIKWTLRFFEIYQKTPGSRRRSLSRGSSVRIESSEEQTDS